MEAPRVGAVGIEVARLNAMGYNNVHEGVFGQHTNPDERHFHNMRAYMWGTCKEWLLYGSIPENDQRLMDDLGAPGYH
jgi:hypothetical protein